MYSIQDWNIDLLQTIVILNCNKNLSHHNFFQKYVLIQAECSNQTIQSNSNQQLIISDLISFNIYHFHLTSLLIFFFMNLGSKCWLSTVSRFCVTVDNTSVEYLNMNCKLCYLMLLPFPIFRCRRPWFNSKF